MATALSMDELMDIGDEQYERYVDRLVAALPHGTNVPHRPPAVLRMQEPDRDALAVMRAVAKCGGWATLADVEEETGLDLTPNALRDMRPWVRRGATGLRLTKHGRAIMREEAASYAQ